MFQYIQYSDKIKAINRKDKYLFKEKIFVKKLLFYINWYTICLNWICFKIYVYKILNILNIFIYESVITLV